MWTDGHGFISYCILFFPVVFLIQPGIVYWLLAAVLDKSIVSWSAGTGEKGVAIADLKAETGSGWEPSPNGCSS
jgi:hypothetical protein